jgi:alkaline phosphatase D
MRRVPVLAALLAAAIGAGAASGGHESGLLRQARFEYGVAAGEITSTSAILWTRAPEPGLVELTVRRGSKKGAIVRTSAGRARAVNDLTVQHEVTGLRPATRYVYAFRQNGHVSPTGAFTTAPRPTADEKVRFAFSGDADATAGANGKPAFNRFQVYARMSAERNDFDINLGDTIYSDSDVPGAGVARTVAAKWEKYRLGLALPALQKLRSSTGLYSQWDDHEFVNDFSRAENGAAIYRAGVKAFRDYTPVTYRSSLGLYRSVRWGRNVELFFLDERSFRSAKASAGGACAVSGTDDLAPTLPQTVRNAFAALAPALANPAPPACLAAIDDPSRTMLGARQYATFTQAIQASTATFKIVVNEVPIQQFYALPYDRWEGYEAERERLLRFLQTNVKNVVFLTTDTHANFINEVRYQTLGGPVESSGMSEVVTGPVATTTFAKEIDGFLGSPGTSSFIGALFFKPLPPAGIGMSCAALDVYSYAEVTVTATTLTVTPRDARGKRVRETSGAPCAPLVIQAQ